MIFVLIIIVQMLGGCRKGPVVHFDPDFYVGDHVSQSIISERGDMISCSDPRFNDYAALHIEKIKELKTLLIRLKIPTQGKHRIINLYQDLENYIKENREN